MGPTRVDTLNQIHQTERGANIHIVTQGDIDALAVCRQIENALRELGLTLPAVTVDLVARIDRQPTGKFKRFVALTD